MEAWEICSVRASSLYMSISVELGCWGAFRDTNDRLLPYRDIEHGLAQCARPAAQPSKPSSPFTMCAATGGLGELGGRAMFDDYKCRLAL